jgi:hypothetical protein
MVSGVIFEFLSCKKAVWISNIIKERQYSFYNRPRRPRGGLGAELHSFFNLGAGWGWLVNATPRQLYLQERDPVPMVQVVGWAPGPV